MNRLSNLLLALFAIAALVASVYLYRLDRQNRRAPEAFARKYSMVVRRPEVMDSLSLAGSASEANDLMADTALRDAIEPVPLGGMPDDVRLAWLDLVPKTDSELEDASELALYSMRGNPGWPYHQALLGETVYTRESRKLSAQLVTRYEQWRIPLLAGATAANVDDHLWQAVAAAYIQTWPDLGRVHQPTSETVFRRAFEDPDFVTDTLAIAVRTIGKERTLHAIPDRAMPLRAAFEQLAKSGDVLTAWSIHQRWDAAEWRERAEDLAVIEKMARRGDVDETRRLCQEWASKHSVWEYDSAAARRQAARVLDLWPSGTEGRWRSDSRAEIIRYFLAGRTADVDGGVLARALDSLANVPEPVEARIRFLAGDLGAAGAIVRSADDFGSFAWTPYILEVARYWASKDKAKARQAFAQLAPAAREECNSVAVLQLIDGNRPAASEVRELSRKTVVGTPIPLCMERPSSLVAAFSATAPAIVDYGWDGARSGSVLLESAETSLRMPAPEREGMRSLTTKLVVSAAAVPDIAVQIPGLN